MANVIFKVGTKVLFNQLEQKDTNTLYWLTDTHEIYKGDVLFGVGLEATQEAAGLLSAEDKIRLDNLAAGAVAGLTPVDASVVIADGEDGKTIGVQISKEAGNTIVLKADGLFAAGVNAPEFAIEKQGEATDGYAATYRLKRTLGDEATYVGDAINIPKDLVLQSGSIQTVTEANQPYDGAEIGDTYIDLQLNDPDSSHIYIPAKGLIDMSEYDGMKEIIDSMPDEILSEIVNVQRTDTTNTAEIRIFTKQEDGTYSPAVQHGVLTLIGAGSGPDGKSGAGLMTLADKQKLDSIDPDKIESISESLVWGTM